MRDWGKNQSPPSRAEDLRLLALLLDAHGEDLDDGERQAFADMRAGLRDRFRLLTEKQRSWVRAVADRFESAPAENLVTRGLVPRGREVETIPALRRENLPLKPPGRR